MPKCIKHGCNGDAMTPNTLLCPACQEQKESENFTGSLFLLAGKKLPKSDVFQISVAIIFLLGVLWFGEILLPKFGITANQFMGYCCFPLILIFVFSVSIWASRN